MMGSTVKEAEVKRPARSIRAKVWLAAGLFLLTASIFAGVLAAHWHANREWQRTLAGSYFSRADRWIALGGTWTSNAAQIQNNSEERGAKLIARTGNWKDFQVQADLQIAEPFGEAGLIVRSHGEEEGVDAYHGYFAGVRTMDSSIELGRADFGWRSMAHSKLPANADPHQWLHLHVVAVGCRIGFEVTLPDGASTTSLVDDADCIASGSFGLRSYLTSAKWRNLQVSSATEQDLTQMEQQSKAGINLHDLLLTEPSDPASAELYTTSMRAEARRHETQPGVTPIGDFRLSPGRHSNVTIQGVIISTPPLADIQDDSGSLIALNVDPRVSLKLGDVVEAQGTVISERFRSQLEDAKIRVLWSDTPVPPLAVTAAQLTGGTYRGRFVEVEGTLISTESQPGGYELTLQDGDQTFRALGSLDFRLDPARLEPGSRLRLRGTATSLDQFTHGIYPFTVITDRVDVVSGPPWWSLDRIAWLVLGCIPLFVCFQWILHRIQAWHTRSLLREREELAFEMHDTLAQSFTGIAYQLQAAKIEQRGERAIRTHIQNALDMVHASHRDASRTISALRPQYRQASDIVAALKELAERLSDGGDLRIKTQVEGKNANLPLAVTDALFRIGQEAVTNAVQHSGCRTLDTRLKLMRSEAQLTVRDDGCGIVNEEQEHGFGIAGMKSRAAKVHAHFDIVTTPFQGTCVTVTAPLQIAHGLIATLRAILSPER